MKDKQFASFVAGMLVALVVVVAFLGIRDTANYARGYNQAVQDTEAAYEGSVPKIVKIKAGVLLGKGVPIE